MGKRGQVWISAVLFILIISLVMVLVLEAITPIIESMRDKSVFVRERDSMLSVGQYIRDVSVEGQGSQRVVPIEIQKGGLLIADNSLAWSMETEANILEPRAVSRMGDLTLTLNGDVKAYETNTSIALENSYVKFVFNRTGTESNYSALITTGLILNASFKKSGSWVTVNSPGYDFYVNDQTATRAGNGYTKLVEAGNSMGSGSVIAHINSSEAEYDLTFTLEARADYMRVKVTNLLIS